jgi:hypothetical protein
LAYTIEIAKSGRAQCRSCRTAIAKGELRFGEPQDGAFGDAGEASYRWHHLKCAASKVPDGLREALAGSACEVPERAELDKLLAEADAKKPPPFPHADRAPTSRARCLECGEPIAKGDLRVAIEREIERGMTTTKGSGYLHPKCAATYAEGHGSSHDELTASLRANTKSLSDDDLDQLFAVV